MKAILFPLGLAALGLVIVPPALFMTRTLTNLEMVKHLMLVGTLLWFGTAPFWMKKT
jgi:hypothetical protein